VGSVLTAPGPLCIGTRCVGPGPALGIAGQQPAVSAVADDCFARLALLTLTIALATRRSTELVGISGGADDRVRVNPSVRRSRRKRTPDDRMSPKRSFALRRREHECNRASGERAALQAGRRAPRRRRGRTSPFGANAVAQGCLGAWPGHAYTGHDGAVAAFLCDSETTRSGHDIAGFVPMHKPALTRSRIPRWLSDKRVWARGVTVGLARNLRWLRRTAALWAVSGPLGADLVVVELQEVVGRGC
jgi:hypothetical protein